MMTSLRTVGGCALLIAVTSVPGLASSASATDQGACSVVVPTTGTVDADDVPQGTDVIACDLVGSPLDLGPATLEIPPAGEKVELSADGVNGEGLSAETATGADGEVSYSVHEAGDPAAATAGAAAAAATPAVNGCDDDYIGATKSTKLTSKWKFYIGDGGLPAGGTRAQLASALETAGNTWYTENSPCFSADGSSAPDLDYGGSTTTEADISTAANCTARDNTSTIDAGDLPSGTVAVNCTWSTSNSYDVLGVLTHETGHTYGLKDKEAASSRRQTMYYQSFYCSVSPRDLGRSDVRHLRSIY
jgi:hypothetical protein